MMRALMWQSLSIFPFGRRYEMERAREIAHFLMGQTRYVSQQENLAHICHEDHKLRGNDVLGKSTKRLEVGTRYNHFFPYRITVM
ncbi:hypothetical protein VNO77_44377 [Canavalia gladiata]|uniref:Uncharacterized protein n=1 Tax=Canavalia gladiata TaxID=3824 RepID=A0AAN9PQQ3_CANGL